MTVAVFGGGCFWCTEAVFKRLRGVKQVLPGYCGGHIDHPTYRQVCEKTTGHIEVIRIEFDPAEVSYETLTEVFFHTHDPTTLDRQGHDIGPQYASAIFYQDEEQEKVARQVMERVQAEFKEPIVTKILPASTFWLAEEYHHDYFTFNPEQAYCALVISPKVTKFMQQYANRLKD